MLGVKYLIDEAEEEVWNTGNNRCVLDFIIWYYTVYSKDKHKGIHLLTMEKLINIIDPNNEYNVLEEGVSFEMLKPFSDHY